MPLSTPLTLSKVGLSLLLLAILHSVARAAEAPPARYAVQVGAFETEAEAQAMAQQVAAAQLPPARIEHGADAFWRVLVGAFPVTVDAMIFRDEVRESGFAPQAFVKALSAVQEGIEDPTPLDPLPSILSNKLPATAPDETVTGDPRFQVLEQEDQQGTDTSYRQALEAALSQTATNDPFLSYLQTNLAILDIKAQDYNSAAARVLPVTTGQVPSTPTFLAIALHRLAWVRHNHSGDRLAAYKTYTLLQALNAGPATRSLAVAERVALLMELAESGKGSHEEVRWAATAWKDQIDPQHHHRRGVVDLVVMESFVRQPEPDYAEAAQRGEAFIQSYDQLGQSAPRRELDAALFQTAAYQRLAGNPARARLLYRRILQTEPNEKSQFAGLNPHAQAMLGLAYLAHDEGAIGLRDQLTRDAVELFPGDTGVREMKQGRPGLLTSVSPSTWVEARTGKNQTPQAPKTVQRAAAGRNASAALDTESTPQSTPAATLWDEIDFEQKLQEELGTTPQEAAQ